MERAPQEILQNIVQDLPREDLFRVRLVSKSLASASAPFLFQTISLWLSLKSLEGLTRISNHPELSQYVVRIVCSTLRFFDHGNSLSTHRAEVRDWLECLTDSTNENALALGKYMSAYQGYIYAQKYLTESDLDFKILTRALKRLPKLDSVVVDPCDNHMGFMEINRSFGNIKASRLFSFDSAHFMPTLFRALRASGSQLSQLQLGKYHYSSSRRNAYLSYGN